MIYDGFDFSGLLRCNPSRRVAAPVSARSVQVPGMDGELPGEVLLGPMAIEVDATVVARVRGHERFAELRRLLASRLLRREPAWLVLDDDPSVRYRALMTDAPELSGWWPGASVTLTFTCHDPVGYGRRARVALSEGANEVLVGGTYPARPVFTVQARPGEAVRVGETAGGRHVQVDAAQGAREVVVDCGLRRATSGGEAAPVTLTSRYFELAPGTAELTLSGGAGTVEYDERWV